MAGPQAGFSMSRAALDENASGSEMGDSGRGSTLKKMHLQNILSRVVCVFLLNCGLLAAQDTRACGTLLALLRTVALTKGDPLTSPRVEIRVCGPNGGTARIAAWGQHSTAPSLEIDTGDFDIFQTFARENIFVIETSGATHDQVYVIGYTNGEPRVLYRKVTKEWARLRVMERSLEVTVPGIYAGDAPPRVETRKFEFAGGSAQPAK